jgi:hypothetical protein
LLKLIYDLHQALLRIHSESSQPRPLR